MADYLALDINKFQGQIMNFIEIYYNLLRKGKEEKIGPYIHYQKEVYKKWVKQIIQLLDVFYEEDYGKSLNLKSRKQSIKEDLNKFNKNSNLEFYLILDIAELLYETYFDLKNKSKAKKSFDHIMRHMARCVYKELIVLRNYLSHKENPLSEYVLRFYEDQYFFIKCIKPNESKYELDDYALKDIKLNIHIHLQNNINNIDSFDLNPLKEEFIKYREENEINQHIPKKNFNFKINNNNLKKLIESNFKFTPFKLPKYNFIEKGLEITNDTKDENTKKSKINNNSSLNNMSSINDDYNFSLDEESRNSISSAGNISNTSSQSSEKNSIKEQKTGNLKEGEQSFNISAQDIQNDI